MALSTETRQGVQRLLDRVLPALRPEAVYLFGSRARGAHRPDSDYDLLLIMPDDAAPERLNMMTAFEATRGLDVAVDVLSCRRSVFERKKLMPGTLSRAVWLEGVLLHGD